MFPTVNEESWPNIYSLAKCILYDNKIIEMQYKIIHRIIGTNKLLFNIGISASPNCA